MRHLFLGLIIGAVLVLVLWFTVLKDKSSSDPSRSVISTFGECVRGGFEVIEGVPRKCVTPDGREFVEEKERKPVGI